jgi:hypothetical protein
VGHSEGHAKSSYIKNRNLSKNNLVMHLKLLKKQEQSKCKTSIQREVIKIRAKNNEIESKPTIQRTNETKSWFFEKINSSNKSLVNMTKGWREKTQINKIRAEKGGITTNTQKNP